MKHEEEFGRTRKLLCESKDHSLTEQLEVVFRQRVSECLHQAMQTVYISFMKHKGTRQFAIDFVSNSRWHELSFEDSKQ